MLKPIVKPIHRLQPYFLLTPAGASASGTLLGLDISSIIAVLGYHSFQTEKGSC